MFLKKCLLLILFSPLIFLPCYADDLDEECNQFCVNNGFEDGYYLPPEPGASCNEGYEQNSVNQICCCKKGK